MNNRTKGVIAGIAGLALLTGGTTFALWSDSTGAIAGGTITNGNLALTAASLTWKDVSPDRADANHAINDLSTWRMVPGDTIEGDLATTITLVGDNLVANLLVDTNATNPVTLPAGMAVTYDVFLGTTKVASAVTLGTDTPLRLAAPRLGQAAGAPTGTGQTVLTGPTALKVVINASFGVGSNAVTNRTSVEATTILNGITVSLTQDRTGTDFVTVP